MQLKVMVRMLKVYVASILCSAVVFVSSGLAQTETPQNKTVAADEKDANAQPPGAAQGTAIEPSLGCPIRVPLTPEGDIKVEKPPAAAGAHMGPVGGIRAIPRCPMPPIEARPVIAPGEIAQWMGYESMFINIDVLNRVAESDEKKGDHEAAYLWRTHDARAAGLNDTEGQILNEVAVDCLRALKEQDEKVRAAVRKFRLATGGDITAPTPPELYQMGDDRIAIIKSHMAQLSVALGSSSFQKLDKYVSAVFTPKPQKTVAPGQK